MEGDCDQRERRTSWHHHPYVFCRENAFKFVVAGFALISGMSITLSMQHAQQTHQHLQEKVSSNLDTYPSKRATAQHRVRRYVKIDTDWPWSQAHVKYTGSMGLNSNRGLNLSTVVMHGTEVYLENEWSWDSTSRLPQLLGKVGQEIKVGCRVINGSTHQQVTQISITEIKTKKSQKKNCALEKLDCWCNFTLVQPVFVVCLWAQNSVGLSFKFKIVTMMHSFAALKVPRCHFLAWRAAQYAEVGNQVKLEIRYSQESVTDAKQINGTPVTLTAPNSRKWIVSVNCPPESKMLSRSELNAETSWYSQDYGYCSSPLKNLQVWCQGKLSVEMSPELGGKWLIGGPEGFQKEFPIIAVLRPFVSKIGPYVVKQNHIQELLTSPVRSLKKVVLSLSTANISSIRPHCAPFLSTLYTGWLAWLHSRSMQEARTRRDLLATALGGGGAGLGVLNSMNAEVLANKLEAVTSGVQGLLNPLNSSLTSLGMGQWLVSEVLPTWEHISEKDHQVLLQALGIEQNNVSLALSCIQAQMWVQSVIAGILRDGDNGILPTEIRKIVWDAATEKERQLQAWWRLVNFTHDQVLNSVIAHVLTVVEARIEKVYPIVALGINTNGSVVYPLDHRMWARVSDRKWQSVDLEACILEQGLGFICEDDALKASDVCFDTSEGVCHFEINPRSNNKTMLVYVGKGCVCFRTMCKYVQINDIYNQTVFNDSNTCACNVAIIRGCDFVYKPPVFTSQLLIRNYSLYRSITPTPIGMDLSLVKEMLEHANLQQLLENAKAEAKKILITVHHDGNVIKQIVERIKRVGEHHWWEIFFGWSPTATGIFNALLHPVVIILLMQMCVCFAMVATCYWIRQVRLCIENQLKGLGMAKRLLP
ncbi:uncharacterized protein LOC422926 [Gallus gallus]|uniref:Uncharacterized protein n=1 Tax=Gallus gallus TaxID=9031 RepID=C7ACT2_CHICK|nr:uncharacterized protein LOC422926 [Gallus gallus]ACR23647.1 hypothetical protein [Gallus gallus]|eukprot:NP_001159385.1 uncharacterized protein LOC422926 [Gallus gallus]